MTLHMISCARATTDSAITGGRRVFILNKIGRASFDTTGELKSHNVVQNCQVLISIICVVKKINTCIFIDTKNDN